ncbi:hypothetical protein JWZ98_18395 [Methylomonas sp. EFPC1]|uniref:hypothetical protein n=1 Tax=Methylomonas sp. EFPC1 TaxID=2812647 RepID=UPI0019677F61|nr:hypothetical protein [Methylomonas sp. EFPC1]QSB00610.1 hypothetical protein JWZ98_18395 [Methylomonas sp. EFPC1]
MNAAEHIVDAYFRLCRGCFTLTDKKVTKGNNRQFDILAYHLVQKTQFHIEVGVTHRENWCPTLESLSEGFEKKFFGASPKRKDKADGTTDFEKGKSYFPQIQDTYKEVGFYPESVKRIWVCWIVKDQDNTKPISINFHSRYQNSEFPIEILSLRDFVLPELENTIGTANYDDEVLRTLGFMKQRELQIAVA